MTELDAPPGGRDLLPNLVIAGVSKSGTTSLFRYLAQHPEIFPADIKEVRYFFPLRRGRAPGPVEDYTQHFAGWSGQRYRMESTPGYFHGGAMLARAMDSLLDDAHVVVSLRDPSERFLSYFTFVHSRLRVPRTTTFDEYLAACLRLEDDGASPDAYPYGALATGFYARWLPGWREVFGPRLHLVFFDDLAREPTTVVRGLCAGLGLDELATLDDTAENRTVGYRSASLQRLALGLNRRGGRFFGRHRVMKRSLRDLYQRLNGAPRHAVPQGARARLDDLYRDANAELARQLADAGVANLPPWLRQAVAA